MLSLATIFTPTIPTTNNRHTPVHEIGLLVAVWPPLTRTCTTMPTSASDPQFSTIADQLFETYNRVVHVAHLEALSTSAFAWIDQHCQLPTLRDCAVRSLRALAVCLFPGQAGLPLGVPLVAGAGVGLGMPGLLR
eukprot:Opistho-2@86659